MKEEKEKVKEVKEKKLIAKKDFKFSYNNKTWDLKKGDKFEVPNCLLPNLKTEKVI